MRLVRVELELGGSGLGAHEWARRREEMSSRSLTGRGELSGVDIFAAFGRWVLGCLGWEV